MSDSVSVFENVPEEMQLMLSEDSEFNALSLPDQRELVEHLLKQGAATVEGVKSKFPIIKILHAGAEAVELPKVAGESKGKVVREFEGIVLDQSPNKAFWEKDGSDGSQPDCQSSDGLNPSPWVKEPVTSEEKGGCLACPHNKFGTALKGKGKRCRDSRRLVLKLPDHALPVRLQVPATVIKALDGYLSDCQDQNTPLGSMVTLFQAEAGVNKGGQDSTVLSFSTSRKLSLVEIMKLKRETFDVYSEDFRIGAFEDEGAPAAGLNETDQKAADAMSSAADAEGAAL